MIVTKKRQYQLGCGLRYWTTPIAMELIETTTATARLCFEKRRKIKQDWINATKIKGYLRLTSFSPATAKAAACKKFR